GVGRHHAARRHSIAGQRPRHCAYRAVAARGARAYRHRGRRHRHRDLGPARRACRSFAGTLDRRRRELPPGIAVAAVERYNARASGVGTARVPARLARTKRAANHGRAAGHANVIAMPALFSPVVDPASWNYAAVDGVTIPDGLRYAGYAVRGVRATRAAAGAVQLPATGVLRQLTDAAGKVFVEVQVIPFPIRHVANLFPGGLPTFYLVFDDATGLTFVDGDADLGGTTLRTATSVTILAIRQDRMLLDPALWAAQLANAITLGGGDASQWQPFVDAITTATATGDTAPVLLYDHAGAPRVSGNVDIVLGAEGTLVATLAPEDAGDLQRTVARMHAIDPGAMPISSLWSGGRTSFVL